LHSYVVLALVCAALVIVLFLRKHASSRKKLSWKQWFFWAKHCSLLPIVLVLAKSCAIAMVRLMETCDIAHVKGVEVFFLSLSHGLDPLVIGILIKLASKMDRDIRSVLNTPQRRDICACVSVKTLTNLVCAITFLSFVMLAGLLWSQLPHDHGPSRENVEASVVVSSLLIWALTWLGFANVFLIIIYMCYVKSLRKYIMRATSGAKLQGGASAITDALLQVRKCKIFQSEFYLDYLYI
jgi:hypothetical protein